MRKYVVTSKMFVGELIFEYNHEGLLMSFVNRAEMSVEQLSFLTVRFPFTDTALAELGKTISIQEITDLSFARFWKDYDCKLGNKKQAEKLWVALGESERIAIFEHLPKYNYHLKSNQGIMKAYPSTFLNQRRWENVYK